MGLFDAKYCSICGDKIKFLGNRKLSDGNCCKDCANKLSPFFSERRQSTAEEIKKQIEYREKNLEKVRSFNVTRILGANTKVLLDENKHQFMVTDKKDFVNFNPDVLDFDAITGISMDTNEYKTEIFAKDSDGKSVSFNPKRYEYNYDFYMIIHVNNPYFDEIKFKLNERTIEIIP